jgi:hypothetical protein
MIFIVKVHVARESRSSISGRLDRETFQVQSLMIVRTISYDWF